MAFYSSNFEGETCEYYGTSYSTSYDIVPFQDSTSNPSFDEFSEPSFSEYNSTPYSDAYNPFLTLSEISYSNHHFTDPKLIEHYPIPYETQHAISQSTYEFSEPRSVEYNLSAYSDAYEPFLTRFSRSGYEFSEPTFSEYSSTAYSDAYNLFLTRSETSYSTYSVTKPELVEHYPIPYETQDAISHSSYEFSEPRFDTYSDAYAISHSSCESSEPRFDNFSYDPFLSRSEISYSIYGATEPKLIEYNPIPYETQYVISYSTTTAGLDDTEFADDIEFSEYNPTPYGGGYNPTLTYGKPLEPSDEICYPRSSPISSGLSPENFSYGSIPSPYGKDEVNEHVEKPSSKITPTARPSSEITPTEKSSSEITPTKSAKEDEKQPKGGTEDIGHDRGHESEPEGYTCDDNYPWSGYGYNPWSGYGYGVGSEGNEDCGTRYGYGNQVPQTPCGYGSDAMDLCESLFGYWPCLARLHRKNRGHQGRVACEERHENQWMGAADYLFYGGL